jgi:prepilin-type N-terminal cleavage/methylation domain-containing protein
MRKFFRSGRGFTLAEMIISIGVIAIFSVIILQLFVTAKNLNTTSRDLDKSSAAAVNMAEQFKSGTDAMAFIRTGQLESAVIAKDDSSAELTLYYDSKWNRLGSSPETAVSAVFILNASVTGSTGPEILGTLQIKVLTTGNYQVENKRNTELMSLKAEKLFITAKENP